MGIDVPYITLDELKRSPVYNDLRELVPESSPADNDAELQRIIVRAAALINGEMNQNLAATLVQENGEMVVDSRGRLRVHCRNSPIISIASLSYGRDVYNLTAVTDFSHAAMSPWSFTLPWQVGHFGRPGTRLWVDWS